ncbi:zinc knuckle CX2CX4HX4C containing protein [Tanacetum coccineum]
MVDVSKDGDGTLSQPFEVGASETLRSSFASKIRNVDGKILSKDGKPMRRAIRQEHVRVSDQIASDHTVKKVVKVSELRNNEKVQGAAVAIPLEAVKEVSACFDNTLYGYFVGKKLAFPLVENYLKNAWIKYGLERVMNKNVPLILNVWTPNAQVKKDEIKVAPLWVKLRHVLVVAYSEIGLSLITTQLGRPIMLDSYTCNMCINPWGKSDYARALVQVSADVELAKSVVVAIPFLDGTGHSLETVVVEYEWTPPRCGTCCIFDHTDDQCPKKPIEVVTVNEEKDGFVEVKKKKKAKATKNSKQISGVRLSKPVPNFYYRRVEHGDTSKANVADDVQPTSAKQVYKEKEVVTKNSFDALVDDDTMGMSDETNWIHAKHSLNVINESDSEEVDQVIELEQPMNMGREQTKGASTPEGYVSDV